jgi:hypothetical protein
MRAHITAGASDLAGHLQRHRGHASEVSRFHVGTYALAGTTWWQCRRYEARRGYQEGLPHAHEDHCESLELQQPTEILPGNLMKVSTEALPRVEASTTYTTQLRARAAAESRSGTKAGSTPGRNRGMAGARLALSEPRLDREEVPV